MSMSIRLVYFELFDVFQEAPAVLQFQKELERFVQLSRFHGPFKDFAVRLAFSMEIEPTSPKSSLIFSILWHEMDGWMDFGRSR
jgi:hypothetical protein